MSTPCRYCNFPTDDEYLCDPKDPNICIPCQKLVEIERHIKEIRKMLVGFESQRRKLKEEVNYAHDRLVHHLPPEIAAHIFVLCLPDNTMDINLKASSKHTFGVPLILSAVCTRWRAIARSTPQLWTAIPLHLRVSGSHSFPPPILVREWIDRSGKLPLSINLCVTSDIQTMSNGAAVEIIKVLNQCSHRWFELKYKGPASLLFHFPRDEQDLPQLRTFHLANSSQDRRIKVPLPLTRLNALFSNSIALDSYSFEWAHLTQLVLANNTIAECLEALRRAPLLTRCSFYQCRTGWLLNEFPLPSTPIVLPQLQFLEIWAPVVYGGVLAHLSCPSLKSLFLNFHVSILSDAEPVKMALIVEFLRRSGCSLESLSLLNANIPVFDIGLLCQGIPTLQHLHVSFFKSPSASPGSLFAYLAKFTTTVNGGKEPRHLPALRSLTLFGVLLEVDDWTTLPYIFGTAGTERYRHALSSVTIVTLQRQEMFNLATRDQILWLREENVKWSIRREGQGDMLAKALDPSRYHRPHDLAELGVEFRGLPVRTVTQIGLLFPGII